MGKGHGRFNMAHTSGDKNALGVPDECVACGTSCHYGPHGPKGEQQCKYCGKAQRRFIAVPIDDGDRFRALIGAILADENNTATEMQCKLKDALGNYRDVPKSIDDVRARMDAVLGSNNCDTCGAEHLCGPHGPGDNPRCKFCGKPLKTDPQHYVECLAAALLTIAERNGMVVTIEQQSMKPLAMGNYESVVSVRERLKP